MVLDAATMEGLFPRMLHHVVFQKFSYFSEEFASLVFRDKNEAKQANSKPSILHYSRCFLGLFFDVEIAESVFFQTSSGSR